MVREKIKASQLVNFLQNHVLGRKKATATQLKAADILLRKCIPDLNRTEVTGKDGGPVESVGIVTDDPLEAGRQYQRLISGK